MVRILSAGHVIGYTRDDITAGGHRYDVILDTGGHRPLSQLRGPDPARDARHRRV